MKKLIPVVIAVVLGFFFIKSCMKGENVLDATKSAISETTGAAGDLAAGAGDLAAGAGDLAKDAAGATGNLAKGAVDATGDLAKGAAGAAGDLAKGAGDLAKGVAGGVVDASGKAVNAFGDAIGKLFSFSLPGGGSINIPKGGFEEGVLNALKNGSFKPGSYYAFDRLYFASGSATVNDSSADQVASTAKILKAYKDIKVSLRGHTDNTGSAAANSSISLARANAVKAKLVAQGIDASRISTSGLGSKEPITENETPEGRQRNRRIDISLAK